MREKERTIKDVIRKVATWRRLYTGLISEEGALVRYSLEDAAHKVQLSKKSLDDYLLQLRLGRKYNFDFKEKSGEMVGVLRNHIKRHRASD